MHEVSHSFTPTSPSRVTTWWGAISCREWWRWLTWCHNTLCTKAYMQQALRKNSLTHTHALTCTVHMHWWYIPLLAMYVHGTHWSVLTAHIIVYQAMGPLHIICITPLYVNMYICICSCILCIAAPHCGAIRIWLLWRFSVQKDLFHKLWCFLRYILNCMCHLRQFVEISVPPFSGVLISTIAFLVVLWVVSVTVLGVVTAVLSWQNFKLKQKGMLGHMDDIEMNVSTCSWEELVLPFLFSLSTKELLPLLSSPSSPPRRPWQHPAPTKSQLLFSGEGPSVTMQ